MSIIPRVLYVDDDQDNCEMMKYWIREECVCDIVVAMDGKQALELIDSEFFDLFLLDYCLPDTTGIKLCETIRTRYPEVPIALYSALDRPIDKQRALAAGATSYMVKPEQLDQIKPFLDRHLSRRIPAKVSLEKSAADPASSKGVHRGRTRASGIV
ncbi:MAG: response regulator [bacterium]|nr:response regulator [bacterium]